MLYLLGTSCPRPRTGLCPWTLLGDFRPQTPSSRLHQLLSHGWVPENDDRVDQWDEPVVRDFDLLLIVTTAPRALVVNTTSTSTQSTLLRTPARRTRARQSEFGVDASLQVGWSTAGHRASCSRRRGLTRRSSTSWQAVWRPLWTSTCAPVRSRHTLRSACSWNAKPTAMCWQRTSLISRSRRLCRSARSCQGRIESRCPRPTARDHRGGVATAGRSSCRRATASRTRGCRATRGSDWRAVAAAQRPWRGRCRADSEERRCRSATASMSSRWRRASSSTPAPGRGDAESRWRYSVTWPEMSAVAAAGTRRWRRQLAGWSPAAAIPSTSTRRRQREKRRNFSPTRD